RYPPSEAETLLAHADAEGLMLLTTEKDLARLAGDPDVSALAARAQALPVRLVAEDEPAFRRFILEKIGKA
ncbi:MAG: tetraacyldisaccharide 4'-kinase, partial [Microvirga sp.]